MHVWIGRHARRQHRHLFVQQLPKDGGQRGDALSLPKDDLGEAATLCTVEVQRDMIRGVTGHARILVRRGDHL